MQNSKAKIFGLLAVFLITVQVNASSMPVTEQSKISFVSKLACDKSKELVGIAYKMRKKGDSALTAITSTREVYGSALPKEPLPMVLLRDGEIETAFEVVYGISSDVALDFKKSQLVDYEKAYIDQCVPRIKYLIGRYDELKACRLNHADHDANERFWMDICRS